MAVLAMVFALWVVGSVVVSVLMGALIGASRRQPTVAASSSEWSSHPAASPALTASTA